MRPRRDCGFTLVESLVAVTLLALLFGALLPVFQNGLTVLGRGDRHLRAVHIAQSLLSVEASGQAENGAAAPRPARAAGEQGDFAWQVLREAYDGDDGAPLLDARAAVVLVRVTAVVTWPGNVHGVRLSTLAVDAVR
jgi:prepilin-type N-terminal cleavage/methylation domain-containing protein